MLGWCLNGFWRSLDSFAQSTQWIAVNILTQGKAWDLRGNPLPTESSPFNRAPRGPPPHHQPLLRLLPDGGQAPVTYPRHLSGAEQMGKGFTQHLPRSLNNATNWFFWRLLPEGTWIFGLGKALFGFVKFPLLSWPRRGLGLGFLGLVWFSLCLGFMVAGFFKFWGVFWFFFKHKQHDGLYFFLRLI